MEGERGGKRLQTVSGNIGALVWHASDGDPFKIPPTEEKVEWLRGDVLPRFFTILLSAARKRTSASLNACLTRSDEFIPGAPEVPTQVIRPGGRQ